MAVDAKLTHTNNHIGNALPPTSGQTVNDIRPACLQISKVQCLFLALQKHCQSAIPILA